jgi:hypothetical protein
MFNRKSASNSKKNYKQKNSMQAAAAPPVPKEEKPRKESIIRAKERIDKRIEKEKKEYADGCWSWKVWAIIIIFIVVVVVIAIVAIFWWGSSSSSGNKSAAESKSEGEEKLDIYDTLRDGKNFVSTDYETMSSSYSDEGC